MSKLSIPNCKKTDLSKLNKQVQDLFSKKKASTVEICLLSAGIRDKYLTQVDGRPAYAAEFNNWIENGSGRSQYGDKSNFTKYAGAGDAINYFANIKKPKKDDFDYVNALPLNSVSALYEINKIISVLDGVVDHRAQPRIFTLFHGRVQRRSGKDEVGETNTNENKKLIHPQSRANDLKNWREGWEGWISSATKVVKPAVEGIKFTELRINTSLFEWNQAGKKSDSQVSFKEFSEELARLQKVLLAEGFISTDKNKGIFKLDISEQQLASLQANYEAKEQKVKEKIDKQRAEAAGTSKKQKYKESA
jgi:hypothetical protein